ncbi:MAG: hypothetical protein JHC98_03000 [Thermoleophilaceae bacterium]|nr:hypothetical protein [Thermoleophilaceae bacterium]
MSNGEELGWSEDDYEEELRTSFFSDCPERALVSLATSFARSLIEDSPIFEVPGPEPEAQKTHLLLAAQLTSTRMLRAARAATASLSIGYEPEARALIRIMVELAPHAEYWQTDPTGELAREWLDGKHEYGVTKKVAEILDRGIYKELCIDAHGDPRSLFALMDPNDFTISMGPDRTMNSRTYLLVITDAVVESSRLLARQFNSDSEKHFALLDEERAKAWKQLREERETSR